MKHDAYITKRFLENNTKVRVDLKVLMEFEIYVPNRCLTEDGEINECGHIQVVNDIQYDFGEQTKPFQEEYDISGYGCYIRKFREPIEYRTKEGWTKCYKICGNGREVEDDS